MVHVLRQGTEELAAEEVKAVAARVQEPMGIAMEHTNVMDDPEKVQAKAVAGITSKRQPLIVVTATLLVESRVSSQ